MTNCEGSGQEARIDGDGYLHCRHCYNVWPILQTAESHKLPPHIHVGEAHGKVLRELVDHIAICETCTKYAKLSDARKMSKGQAREKFCERGKKLCREAMRYADAMA